MAIEKFTNAESKLEVLKGEAAQIINRHFHKTGKFAVSEFTDDEKSALEKDLSAVVEDAPVKPVTDNNSTVAPSTTGVPEAPSVDNTTGK